MERYSKKEVLASLGCRYCPFKDVAFYFHLLVSFVGAKFEKTVASFREAMYSSILEMEYEFRRASFAGNGIVVAKRKWSVLY